MKDEGWNGLWIVQLNNQFGELNCELRKINDSKVPPFLELPSDWGARPTLGVGD